MKTAKLLLIFITIISCCNKKNDTVELSYKFKKEEKKLELLLYNNTQEDFIVLIPRTISFTGNSSSTGDKTLDSKNPEATLSKEEQTNISRQMTQIESVLNPDTLMNDRKYFPTAILIKKKEKKRLDYRLNNDFVTDRIYKSKFFKMRDVLNISQNIDILKKMVDYRQNDHYKIYIDDFNIKDSLQVKF